MGTPDNTQKKSSGSLTKLVLISTVILLVAAVGATFFQKESALDGENGDASSATATTSNPAARRPANGPTLPTVLPSGLLEAKIRMLDGKPRKLADYSGKVLVVDIWATWCGPCREEIPHLVELAKEYKSKGVEVIGLTTEDPVADVQLVRQFSKEFKINYPIGWAEDSIAEGLMNGRGGIPQTLIIGRDGKVRKHFVGFNPIISVPQMKQALDEAVAAG